MDTFFDSVSQKMDQDPLVTRPTLPHRPDGPMRSSLEVLQRMANGIEPFDYNRFRCAVAALPHESPRLTASVQVQEHRVGYAGRLTEALMNKKRRELGLTVIDNEPGPEAA